GQRLGHRGQLHLVEPDVALHRGPVLAAPLDRPVRHGEPVIVEDLVRGDDVLTRQLAAVLDTLTDLRGDLRAVELPQLVAEGHLVRGQGYFHTQLPLCLVRTV